MSASFTYYSFNNPCPLCGGRKGCRFSPNFLQYFCLKNHHRAYVPGFDYHKEDKNGVFGIYYRTGERPRRGAFAGYEFKSCPSSQPSVVNHQGHPEKPKTMRLRRIIRVIENDAEYLEPYSQEFKKQLGIDAGNAEVFGTLYLKNNTYNKDCWVTPERDGKGKIIAYNLRYEDGKKQSYRASEDPKDSGRGIFFPDSFKEMAAATPYGIFCPEGFSDALALHAMGLVAAGRPNNIAGVDHLAELFRNNSIPNKTPIFIIGENDRDKVNNLWPGRSGAIKTAQELADLLQRPVFYVLPPDGIKDSRDWYKKLKEQYPQPAAGFFARLYYSHCQANAVACHPGKALPSDVTADLLIQDLVSDEAHASLDRIALQEKLEQDRIRDGFLQKKKESHKQCDKTIWSLPRKSKCGFCRSMWHPEKKIGQGIKTRCGSWKECEFCRYLNQLEHKAHIESLLETYLSPVFIGTVANEDLPTRSKEIKRADMSYKAIQKSDGDWLVISNYEFRGSAAEQPMAAIGHVKRAIDAIPRYYEGKAITSSRRWTLPKPEDQGFVDLGGWNDNLDELRDFLLQFKEVRIKPSSAAGNWQQSRTIQRSFLFELTCHVNAEIIRNLQGWIAVNGGLDSDCWTLPEERSLRVSPPGFACNFRTGKDKEEMSEMSLEESIKEQSYKDISDILGSPDDEVWTEETMYRTPTGFQLNLGASLN